MPAGDPATGNGQRSGADARDSGSIEAASRVIAEGNIRRIDVRRVNGRLFFNVAHIGLGAEVTHILTRDAKDKWGSVADVKYLLPVFTKRRSFRTHIECNGVRREFRSIEVEVGNGRHYGGVTVAG